jgi:hypothetical protein
VDPAFDPSAWSDFAVAVAGASAAFAGLLFVAMSINVKEILSEPSLPPRAAGAVVTFAAPLVFSVLLLVPGQSEEVLGAELIAVGVVLAAILFVLVGPRQASGGHRTTTAWLVGTGAPALLLAGSTVLAGVGMLTTSVGGLNWLAVAVIAAIYGGLVQAWVLLIEILR